ncbi:MAG: hypothetical protein FJ317_04360 [SAR202 cluster bacterium]|nr:hypothetical protein [SAR202 cluster bacterium]
MYGSQVRGGVSWLVGLAAVGLLALAACGSDPLPTPTATPQPTSTFVLPSPTPTTPLPSATPTATVTQDGVPDQVQFEVCMRLGLVTLQAPRNAFADEAAWQKYTAFRETHQVPLQAASFDDFWAEMANVYQIWRNGGATGQGIELLSAAIIPREFDTYDAILASLDAPCGRLMESADWVASAVDVYIEYLQYLQGLEEDIAIQTAAFAQGLRARVETGFFQTALEEGCLRFNAAMMGAPDDIYADEQLKASNQAFRQQYLGGDSFELLTPEEFWQEMGLTRAALVREPDTATFVAALDDALAAGGLDRAVADRLSAVNDELCTEIIFGPQEQSNP